MTSRPYLHQFNILRRSHRPYTYSITHSTRTEHRHHLSDSSNLASDSPSGLGLRYSLLAGSSEPYNVPTTHWTLLSPTIQSQTPHHRLDGHVQLDKQAQSDNGRIV